ncbi:MAG: alpha/beta family hydrolase, partial [Myxococcota bacterium]
PAGAADPEPTRLAFQVQGRNTSALLSKPVDARALVVLGHGARLTMRSPLPATLAEALASRRVATLRFNFPFAEAGREKPDPLPVMIETVRTAVRLGGEQGEGLPMVLAGQSLSGLIVARVFEGEAPPVSGVAMIGFPLHQAGRPSGRNARQLEAIPVPLLLVQGSRDPLAELRLVRALAEQLEPQARLHVVAGADHLFEPESGSGSERARPMIDEVAGAISDFVATLEANPGR